MRTRNVLAGGCSKLQYSGCNIMALFSLISQKKTIRLPDVIGIGMEHCGINALIDLLRPHPSVRLSTDGNGSVPFFNLQNDAHIDKYL